MSKVLQQSCLTCGNPVDRKPNKYCSNACQVEHEHMQYITRWKAGEECGYRGKTLSISNHIRKYLLRKYHNACQLCGWSFKNPHTGLYPLQVHHKDGQAKNCVEDNLQLLCPSCHSLTPNFGWHGGGQRVRKD